MCIYRIFDVLFIRNWSPWFKKNQDMDTKLSLSQHVFIYIW